MLFGTHAHLDEDAFNQDVDEVIARAVASGVTTMLVVATTVESSRATIRSKSCQEIEASTSLEPAVSAKTRTLRFSIQRVSHMSPDMVRTRGSRY